MTIHNSYSVVFFDGLCNLCDGFISYIVKVANPDLIKIASLQGETAAMLFKNKDLPDSIIFFENGVAYFKSEAVLRIGKKLGGPHRILANCCFVFPAFLRDFIYDWIAKRRYSFFGKKETCRLPTAAEKEFFLP